MLCFLDNDFWYEIIKNEIDMNFILICVLIYKCLFCFLYEDFVIILNINLGLGLVFKISFVIYCVIKGVFNIFF